MYLKEGIPPSRVPTICKGSRKSIEKKALYSNKKKIAKAQEIINKAFGNRNIGESQIPQA